MDIIFHNRNLCAASEVISEMCCLFDIIIIAWRTEEQKKMELDLEYLFHFCHFIYIIPIIRSRSFWIYNTSTEQNILGPFIEFAFVYFNVFLCFVCFSICSWKCLYIQPVSINSTVTLYQLVSDPISPSSGVPSPTCA